MQAMGPPLMQRPFFPAVQSESCQHLGDRPSPASGEHPSRLGSPVPRSCGQRALIGRCCSGVRLVPTSVLPASDVPLPPSAPSEPPDLSSLWSHASARGKARRNAILALLMGTGVGKLQASCPRLHPWVRQGSCQFSRSSPSLYRQLSETRPPGCHQIRGYFGRAADLPRIRSGFKTQRYCPRCMAVMYSGTITPFLSMVMHRCCQGICSSSKMDTTSVR